MYCTIFSYNLSKQQTRNNTQSSVGLIIQFKFKDILGVDGTFDGTLATAYTCQI